MSDKRRFLEVMPEVLLDSQINRKEEKDFYTFKTGIVDKYNQATIEISLVKKRPGGYLVPDKNSPINSPECEFRTVYSQDIFDNNCIDEIKKEHQKKMAECLEEIKKARTPGEIIQCIQNNISLLERWQMVWAQINGSNAIELEEIEVIIGELTKYRRLTSEYLIDEQARQSGMTPSWDEIKMGVKKIISRKKVSAAENQTVAISPLWVELTDKIRIIMTGAYEKYAKMADAYSLVYERIESYFAQIPEQLGGGSEFFLLLEENAGGIADKFAQTLQNIVANLEVDSWPKIDYSKKNSWLLN